MKIRPTLSIFGIKWDRVKLSNKEHTQLDKKSQKMAFITVKPLCPYPIMGVPTMCTKNDFEIRWFALCSCYPDINLALSHYPFQGCLRSCYQSHVMSECSCIDATIPSNGKAVTKRMADPTLEIDPCNSVTESKSPVEKLQKTALILLILSLTIITNIPFYNEA